MQGEIPSGQLKSYCKHWLDMVNIIESLFGKEGEKVLKIDAQGENDDEENDFLRDFALLVFLLFGLSEIRGEGVRGEGTGQNQ